MDDKISEKGLHSGDTSKTEASIEPYSQPERPSERPAANVFELLDRILDKGLVVIGDIRVSVADIELLKIQIRLLIASVDTARKMGIDFSWAKELEQPKTKVELQNKIKELEDKLAGNNDNADVYPAPDPSLEVSDSPKTDDPAVNENEPVGDSGGVSGRDIQGNRGQESEDQPRA
jgi:hypothetical protein